MEYSYYDALHELEPLEDATEKFFSLLLNDRDGRFSTLRREAGKGRAGLAHLGIPLTLYHRPVIDAAGNLGFVEFAFVYSLMDKDSVVAVLYYNPGSGLLSEVPDLQSGRIASLRSEDGAKAVADYLTRKLFSSDAMRPLKRGGGILT